MQKQVYVFFDWQNVYMRAREAFHDPTVDPVTAGQVNPVDLGHVLTSDYAKRHPGEAYWTVPGFMDTGLGGEFVNASIA